MDRPPWRRRRHRASENLARTEADAFARTKFDAPEPRAEWISRSTLVRVLIDAVHERLMLIAAPAGYGKSTLAAQWRRDPSETRRFAWVSLDRGDNDPVILWMSILRALSQATLVPDSSALLKSLHAPHPDIEGTFLPMLVNRFAQATDRVVLVLDSFDHIREAACHQQLESFVNRLPSALQLAIVTRSAPPLPLTRLRAAGELVELHTEQLLFTYEEVDRFVRRVSKVQLPEPELDHLAERTEGWPAAVYLAAQALRDAADPVAFARGFDGTSPRVRNYLMEEVLGPLPEEMVLFLVRTSILEPFTAPLCAAVADTDLAQSFIELDRFDSFLVPVDQKGQWWRHHHLLKDVLREQLDTRTPGEAKTLHRRAGRWYEQHGFVGAAAEHAIAAGDVDRVLALISRDWCSMANTDQATKLRTFLASLSTERLSANPVTAMSTAWMAALAGDYPAAEHWLGTAMRAGHKGPLPDGMVSLESSAALLEGTLGLKGARSMVAAARTAVWLEGDPTSRWYSTARCVLGYAYFATGELEFAEFPLGQAAHSAAAFPAVRMGALAALSLTLTGLGRRAQADELAEAAHDLANEQLMDGEAFATYTRASTLTGTALGAALVRRGKLTEARQLLTDVQRVHQTQPGVPLWPPLENLLRLIDVLIMLGERAEARERAAQAAGLLGTIPSGLRRYRAWLTVLQHRLDVTGIPQAPIEPLTDREIAVLRLLRSNLSLREVGAELFVSYNTVKTHARSIYRKLGASSRDEALRRAGDLGII